MPVMGVFPRGSVLALAAVACAAGVASAGTGVNLVQNGGFEAGAGGNGSIVVGAPGWTTLGFATVVTWDTGAGFPGPFDPGPADRGANFASGGPGNSSSALAQVIDVSGDAALIDSGSASFVLSGWLGGYFNQDDHATLGVQFFSESSELLGAASVVGPLAADREGLTGLLQRSVSGAVPALARSARVTLSFQRVAGDFNDGYADGIGFVLRSPAACPGDFNGDGVVSTPDLVIFLGVFGQAVTPGSAQDFNGDGVVSTPDLVSFLGLFGTACP